MARCNPTMYPGADGCPMLAAALFAAGIPGARNVDCMKNCSDCASETAAPRLRLVPPSAGTEPSPQQRQRSRR